MGQVRVKSIEEPVFVSEEEAQEYRESGGWEEFVSEGWYVQAEVQHVDGVVGTQDIGSETIAYFGPYTTEQDALTAIPQIAPGVLVRIS